MANVPSLPTVVSGRAVPSRVTWSGAPTGRRPRVLAYRSTWLTTGGTPGVAKSSVDALVNGRDGNVLLADGTGRHGRTNSTESGLTMLYANGATGWGPTLDTGDSTPGLKDLSGIQSDSGLTLFDLHGGLPSSGDYTDLPHHKVADWTEIGRDKGRVGTDWTVDRFGGGVAYADTEQRVHVVPAGFPASALTAIDSTVTAKSAGFSGTWWLSKPAAAWKVTVRNTAGATVRTLSGSDARGLLTAAWDGKDSAGCLVVNGTYTWTLTAQPADGQGSALSRSGSLTVTAGAAAARDYAGNDGVGDLLTLNSSGALTVQRGSGKGSFGGRTRIATGWQGCKSVV
jgi:hypothetical protein